MELGIALAVLRPTEPPCVWQSGSFQGTCIVCSASPDENEAIRSMGISDGPTLRLQSTLWVWPKKFRQSEGSKICFNMLQNILENC